MEQRAVASGFARIFQAAGDQVVYAGGEPYRLSTWPVTASRSGAPSGGPLDGSLDAGGVRPSALLQASGAVVDFTGRTAERQRARRWRDAPGLLRVNLLHGPGGQGKTRLAMKIAQEWRAEGWIVLGAFHHRDRQAPPAFDVASDFERAAGVLVVVDYAERWDTEDLLTLLGDTSVGAQRGVRVRVLLLARPSGVWWQNVAYRVERDFGVRAERFELLPLEDDPAVNREGLFCAAQSRFAELLDVPVPGTAHVPAGLGVREEYRLVLAVHMAALATVLATRHGVAPPTDPAEVSAFLLNRERDHWVSLRHRREDPLAVTVDGMGQLVYVATLTGPLGYGDAKQAVVQAGIESLQSPGAMVKDHARCYPAASPAGTVGGPGTVLEPLYPDRLGEDYLALLTHGHHHPFAADPWADDAPARLFAPAVEAGSAADVPVWTRRGLLTLVEASARWPHLADTQLHPLLRARPEFAVLAGGAAVVTLAALPHVDLDVLEAIDALLPEGRSEWAPAAAAIADRLLDRRLAAADDAEGARIRADLSNRLADVGRHERALVLAEEAFMAFHALAPRAPSAHLLDFAYAEGNYAVRLAQVGRIEDALARSNGAMLWLSILAAQDRALHLFDLALATRNHATWLADAGRHEEAVGWSESAVEMLRELATQRVGSLHIGHTRELFSAVSVHAGLLVATGLVADALTYSELALAALRDLVRLDRSEFLPDLPVALNDHARLLEHAGSPLDTLVHSAESVEVLQELARLDPDVHLPDLAQGLAAHAVWLSETGSAVEAAEAAGEAVAVRRVLADHDRHTHLPALVLVVSLLAVLLEEAGAAQEALVCSEEVVVLHRENARRDREPHSLADLVRALLSHASRLREAGGLDEALAYAQEATSAARTLRGGPADTVDLPIAAALHAKLLEEAGRLDEALVHSAETIEIARTRVRDDRDANLPDLAAAVGNHASRLADAGRQTEALDHSRESFDLFAELHERDPDAHLVGYVRNAAILGHILTKGSRFTEAIVPLLFALGMAPHLKEHEHPIGVWVSDLMRAAHAGAPRAVQREYRKLTGQKIPPWFQRPPAP
ncbi:hypothetical protein WN71_020345 [Streptomyces mangrovisoli]|uniref:Uncharacterized protein n=1 Tax=Streptomyces mangrovisoli TaxID=1428628 RepID=A0A1J4NY17_9ACTN|nr:hypothetical protein WN71_020345 [Streptomyces mangrovisoli]